MGGGARVAIVCNHRGGKTRSNGLLSWGDIRVEYVDSYGVRQVRGEMMCHVCISKDPQRKE